MDATYRSDLRELNELNFSRFDAKLEQRLAALDTKWGGHWTQLNAKLEQRLAELESKLIKWMFTFWVPTALGIIGTGIAVIALLLRK